MDTHRIFDWARLLHENSFLKGHAVTKGFVLGLIIAFVGLIAGGYFFVRTGALPAGQDSKPGKLETWAAKTSLSATINRETKGLTSPLQPTESNLTA